MAIHSRTVAWKIPWTEELGRPQGIGSQRRRHDRATNTFTLQGNIISYKPENFVECSYCDLKCTIYLKSRKLKANDLSISMLRDYRNQPKLKESGRKKIREPQNLKFLVGVGETSKNNNPGRTDQGIRERE